MVNFDYSVLLPFISIDLFSLGMELFAIAISIIGAIAWSNTKKDFALAFILIYLITFILGLAQQVWILICLGLIIGWYLTRN